MIFQELDACVIGSGVAGLIVARHLLQRGLSVALVEAGKRYPRPTRREWIDHVTSDTPPRFKLEAVDARGSYVNEGNIGYPLPGSRLFALGGSTLHWEGQALRLKPEDFAARTNSGHGMDFPISYEELEPYYALAEQTLQVAGLASDPGHPPRSSGFPLPPFPFAESDGLIIAGMENLGIHYQHNCVARNTIPVNGYPQCRTIGTCIMCPIMGRFTGDLLAEQIQAHSGVQVYTETFVERLIVSGNRVIQAELRDRQGERRRLVARLFVVAAGALESAKLLLRSQSTEWPQGIGNQHDLVGRYLMEHPMLAQTGYIEQPRPAFNEKPFFTLISRARDNPEAQRDGKYVVECRAGLDPTQTALQRMAGQEAKHYRIPVWANALTEMPASPSNRVANGSRLAYPPYWETRLDLSLNSEWRRAAERIAGELRELLRACGASVADEAYSVQWANHHMGTLRMAKQPTDGVVDANCLVFGTSDLFVAGSALFPCGGAANPTLTIAALAHRLGALLERLL